MRHALAGHADAGDRHAVDFAPDLFGLGPRLGAGGDPDRNLVGLWLLARADRTMDGVEADEVDAHFIGLEADHLEALLQHALGKLGAPQRARPGIEEHVLADEAFGTA